MRASIGKKNKDEDESKKESAAIMNLLSANMTQKTQTFEKTCANAK